MKGNEMEILIIEGTYCNDIHIDWFASGLSFMTEIAIVTVQTMLSAFDFVAAVESVE